MIPSFIRSYEASADILPFRLVAFSDAASSAKVAQGASETSLLMGVSDKMGGDAGQMTDVVRAGLASVELGEAVSAGDPLTSDANGMAVEAVAAAGETVRFVGFADQPGIAGDIIDFFVAPGLLHEPA
ncbi:hypothetical protein [Roseibium sp.]|uniref:hypothetical protein n=1 Tax=Roseibium sp. TaxID=1936156 RepID=UPI003A9802D9